MAESYAQSDADMKNKSELNYLDFVQIAAMQAVMCIASLYGFAKENAGPLKGGVQAVEKSVRSILGPIYERFHAVPFELLCFADRKVGNVLVELDRHVPALVKAPTRELYAAARIITCDVQSSGLSGAAKSAYERYEPVVQEMYGRYEPVAEQYAVATWRYLNKLPIFPQVAQIVVPTAGHWAERYNRAVGSMAARGCMVASYLPEIPTERIAKVFGGGGGGCGEIAGVNGNPAEEKEAEAVESSTVEGGSE